MLAAPQNNLFVVGDDDQSIYGFRGADAKLMFQFQKDYPDAKQILLDINYRSTANIVKNALKVIEHNEVRFDKAIKTKKKAGKSLHVQEVRRREQIHCRRDCIENSRRYFGRTDCCVISSTHRCQSTGGKVD